MTYKERHLEVEYLKNIEDGSEEKNDYVEQAVKRISAKRAGITEAETDVLKEELSDLYDVCTLPMKELMTMCGYTQAGLSDRFCIPRATVTNWYRNERPASPFVRLVIYENRR